mgnify:CR=1 FL=1
MSQLKVNSIVPAGGLPSGANGGIIQVVSATKTDTFTTTAAISSPAAVTGLACTITPSSNSNKILIITNIGMATTTNDDYGVRFHLYRGGSQITGAQGDTSGNNVRVAFSVRTSKDTRFSAPSMMYLDSPATTSATTYQLYCSVEPSGGSACINRDGDGRDIEEFPRAMSTFTVMEVSA